MAYKSDITRPYIEIFMVSGTRYVADCELNDNLSIERINGYLGDKARGFLTLFVNGESGLTSINPMQIESVKPLSK